MLVEVPRNTVLQGHVLDRLRELPCDCVDVVVTSPPYWGLRDYGEECVSVWDGEATCDHKWGNDLPGIRTKWGNKETLSHKQKSNKGVSNNIDALEKSAGNFCSLCGAWKGQLGLEPHPSMFIEHLAEVFLEVKRVLKPSGSLWLNLGDTYFGGNGKAGRPEGWSDLENDKLSGHAPADFIRERNKLRSSWLQPKQKMMIPARVAIALQEQGWILRNEVVWHKVNHMPESVRDRLTRSWESIYFFTKSNKYYFNLNAIKKPLTDSTIQRVQRPYKNKQKCVDDNLSNTSSQKYADKIKHSLAVGRTGNFIYSDPLHTKPLNEIGANPGDVWSLTTEGLKDEHFAAFPQKLVRQILKCACPKGGLVLDPFAGSGTTLLVAHKMGFDWLGVELVSKYCEIIEKRIVRHGKVRLDKFVESNLEVVV